MTALLRARAIFLAWAAVTFIVFGLLAEFLEIADPYPERPFVTVH